MKCSAGCYQNCEQYDHVFVRNLITTFLISLCILTDRRTCTCKSSTVLVISLCAASKEIHCWIFVEPRQGEILVVAGSVGRKTFFFWIFILDN